MLMNFATFGVPYAVFSLYLNICGLRKGPGKFFMGAMESPEKVLDFFVSKSGNPVLRGPRPCCHDVHRAMPSDSNVTDRSQMYSAKCTAPYFAEERSTRLYLRQVLHGLTWFPDCVARYARDEIPWSGGAKNT